MVETASGINYPLTQGGRREALGVKTIDMVAQLQTINKYEQWDSVTLDVLWDPCRLSWAVFRWTFSGEAQRGTEEQKWH